MGWVVAALIAVGLLYALKFRTPASKSNGRAGSAAGKARNGTKTNTKSHKKLSAKNGAKNGSASLSSSGPYAAVSIKPGMSACIAALERGNTRYLRSAAPTLPLADCGQSQCACKLVHHEDRRSDETDDRRMGIGLQSQLYGTSGEEDQRGRRRGRRKTDY